MSSFTNGLVIKFIAESKMFRVYIAFDYHIGTEDSSDVITVPEGFMTDLASIPPVARWLIPKLGKHAQAAVLHDYLYTYKPFERKKCDLIFLEAMKVLRVSFWKRHVMYRAVRLAWWIPWDKNERGEL